MVKVRAKEMGIFRNGRVRPGTVFEWPDDRKLGKWVEVVKEEADDAKMQGLPEKVAAQRAKRQSKPESSAADQAKPE